MPRFYFQSYMGDDIVTDHEGEEFPDVAVARKKALICVREILAEAIKSGKDKIPDRLVIIDGDGRGLDSVSFQEALPTSLK